MTSSSDQTTPAAGLADDAPGTLRLRGRWTLRHAEAIDDALNRAPPGVSRIDASTCERLDTLGVLQLLRYAEAHGLDFGALQFNEFQRPLVAAIENVHDDRPQRKREFGVRAMLGRIGHGLVDNAREITALASFFGEVQVKLLRLFKEPGRFRLTPTVHHMEQIGLDAVPLVALLSFMVGAVIAFLGAMVLQGYGATIFVVELVSAAFLREFGVLLTAILLAGMLGGMAVGAVNLDIPVAAYVARAHEMIEIRHFVVGMAKAPLFALVIGLIGCLEGLQVKGTAQSLGERTTSSVVQAISMVIVIDAFAALWFMQMDY